MGIATSREIESRRATDHDSSDWQLMTGSAQRYTPPRISTRERAEHLNEPRAEVIAAHSLAPPVRILLVADMRSPTTWGWVDAVRAWWSSALTACRGPSIDPGASGVGSRRSVKQRLRSFAGATPRRLKVTGRVPRVVGPVMAPIKGRRSTAAPWNERSRTVVHGSAYPSRSEGRHGRVSPGRAAGSLNMGQRSHSRSIGEPPGWTSHPQGTRED